MCVCIFDNSHLGLFSTPENVFVVFETSFSLGKVVGGVIEHQLSFAQRQCGKSRGQITPLSECNAVEMLYGFRARTIQDFNDFVPFTGIASITAVNSVERLNSQMTTPKANTLTDSSMRRIQTLGSIAKIKSVGDLQELVSKEVSVGNDGRLTSVRSTNAGQNTDQSSRTPLSRKIVSSPFNSTSSLDFNQCSQPLLQPLSPKQKSLSSAQLLLKSVSGASFVSSGVSSLKNVAAPLKRGDFEKPNDFTRLGQGEWKQTKEQMGENVWAEKILALKASIKRKMPSFSSKLFKHYTDCSIENNNYHPPRSVHSHSELSLFGAKRWRIEKERKKSVAAASAATATTSSMSPRYSTMSTTERSEATLTDNHRHRDCYDNETPQLSKHKLELDNLASRIQAFQQKSDSQPIIPITLLEKTMKQGDSAFFKVVNFKQEKSTHRFLIPTETAIPHQLSYLPVTPRNRDLTSKISKQTTNTYKMFKTSIRNYHSQQQQQQLSDS